MYIDEDLSTTLKLLKKTERIYYACLLCTVLDQLLAFNKILISEWTNERNPFITLSSYSIIYYTNANLELSRNIGIEYSKHLSWYEIDYHFTLQRNAKIFKSARMAYSCLGDKIYWHCIKKNVYW